MTLNLTETYVLRGTGMHSRTLILTLTLTLTLIKTPLDTHTQLTSQPYTCLSRELNTILNKFSTVDFNTVPAEDEDLVLIPYQHLWLTLRSLLTQTMPEPVSPTPVEVKWGLECIIIEDVKKGSFRLVVNDHSEIEEYYAAFVGVDYEQLPLNKRKPLECLINPGGVNEEKVHIVGFGSVLLHEELEKNHAAGEVVRVIPTAEWLALNRPPPPALPKELPLLAHLSQLQSLVYMTCMKLTDHALYVIEIDRSYSLCHPPLIHWHIQTGDAAGRAVDGLPSLRKSAAHISIGSVPGSWQTRSIATLRTRRRQTTGQDS